jgi:hypothetical protein
MMLAQQWQKRLHINEGYNAIMMRATIAIATTAKMPEDWRQWPHHNKGSNASLMTCDKGKEASSTMADTPAHQWQQWCHHNNGKDTSILMTAMLPLLQGQRCQLNAWWMTCVHFFLGRIGFLRKTA